LLKKAGYLLRPYVTVDVKFGQLSYNIGDKRCRKENEKVLTIARHFFNDISVSLNTRL